MIVSFFVLLFLSIDFANPPDSTVTILFTGDVTLAKHFRHQVQKNYSYAFARIPWFKRADISVINLENPLTDSSRAIEKPFIFKAPPEYVQILKDANIDLVNLANNHIYDYGKGGLLQTIDVLEKAGIRYVGAGRNMAQARRAAIFKRKGLRIGFLAYYGVRANSESHPATITEPGTALRKLKFIRQDIKNVRPKVDFLAVIFHWGFEKEHYPREHQIKFAHYVINYGADLVVGHHPHVLQGVEKYGHGIIVYSLGNFIFGGKYLTHYQTAVLKVQIPANQPKNWSVKFIPIQVDYWQPHLLKTALADTVLKHIAEYSKIFQSTIEIVK